MLLLFETSTVAYLLINLIKLFEYLGSCRYIQHPPAIWVLSPPPHAQIALVKILLYLIVRLNPAWRFPRFLCLETNFSLCDILWTVSVSLHPIISSVSLIVSLRAKVPEWAKTAKFNSHIFANFLFIFCFFRLWKKHVFGVLFPDAFLGHLFLLIASLTFFFFFFFTRKKYICRQSLYRCRNLSKISFYFPILWFAEMEKPIYFNSCTDETRGLLRDVLYLCWAIAPS